MKLRTCGATIFTKNHVLTAAHCVPSKNITDYYVRAGTKYMVSATFKHKNYTPKSKTKYLNYLKITKW